MGTVDGTVPALARENEAVMLKQQAQSSGKPSEVPLPHALLGLQPCIRTRIMYLHACLALPFLILGDDLCDKDEVSFCMLPTGDR